MLSNLYTLNLGGNSLTKIQNLHHNLKITTLDLSYNLIQTVQNLKHLTLLENLYLNDSPFINNKNNEQNIPKISNIHLPLDFYTN